MATRPRVQLIGLTTASILPQPALFEWTDSEEEATVETVVHVDDGIVNALKEPPSDGRRRIAWLTGAPAMVRHLGIGAVIEEHFDDLIAIFDVVLSCDRRLCERHPVVRYHPARHNRADLPDEQQKIHVKSKKCSMFASDRQMVDGHRYRHEVAARLQHSVDLFGGAHGSPTLGGEGFAGKAQSLAPYMFSVAMENCVVPLYYTEHLTNCFVTGTVPVYWGCREIAEVFDERGVIWLSEDFDPTALTRIYYNSLLPYVRSNYVIAVNLEGAEDQLYRKYIA